MPAMVRRPRGRSFGTDSRTDGIRPDGSGSMRRWDGASTNRLNSAHWAGVSGVPINADLSGRLDILRNRLETEAANNPLVEGMVSTYTLSILGTDGPTLRLVSKDAGYIKRREKAWQDWAARAGSNQQLALVDIMRLWVRSLFFSGEFVNQLITVPDAEGPVQMRLLPIHPHRLMTPPAQAGRPDVAMGVRRDIKNRRPLSYFISQPWLFQSSEVYIGQFQEVPYRDLLHGFLMLEEDQVRGVPWLASAVESIAQLRDLKIDTLDAAKAAAQWAVYLQTNHPDLPAQRVTGTAEFQRGQERVVPPGYEAKQINAQQPMAVWVEFYNALCREIARPVNMPLMMLQLDSSGHNYSSARFDGQLFWRGASYVQSFFSRNLNRLEEEVATEAGLAEQWGPPPADLERRWIWPKAPHADPEKEANAERALMENGTLTYAEACAAHNKDVDQTIEERKRLNQQLEAAGLNPFKGIPERVGGAPGQDKQGQDGQGKGGQGKGKQNGKSRPKVNGNGKAQVNGKVNGKQNGRFANAS